MQKPLLATAIAISTSLASSFAAFAADGSTGGAFVHAGIGKINYLTQVKPFDGKKAGSVDIMGGYRWGLGHSFALGVEGGYADLGSVEKLGPAPARKPPKDGKSARKSKPASDTMTTSAWLVGVNAKWNMTDNVSLIGRAGSARMRTDFEHRDAGENTRAKNVGSVSRRTSYAGLGLSYAVNDHLDLTVQATRYGNRSVNMKNEKGQGNDWSATTYNAGLEYRF